MSESSVTSAAAAWRPVGSDYVFNVPDLSAKVSNAGGRSTAVNLTISCTLSSAQSVQLDLEGIAYAPEHGQRTATPFIPIEFLVQQPNLVIVNQIASTVGLRMVIQILAETHGLAVDVRMETVAALDEVELFGTLLLNGMSLDPPRFLGDEPGRGPCGYGLRLGDRPVSAAVLFDHGEGGCRPRRTPVADALAVSWFGQPLEKGVILVGRFAIIAEAGLQASMLRETYRHWLDRPTFL